MPALLYAKPRMYPFSSRAQHGRHRESSPAQCSDQYLDGGPVHTTILRFRRWLFTACSVNWFTVKPSPFPVGCR